eukprot:CAMPEP_0168503348 /NCGR_PEP_ID=MMETSP0228-20121227/75813_1 /TAXON_ID=133427 /ORGANISM="Protoceratium reticulatum, Strain CCCM 535 (=CCMP 1889)" /LENGTH=85 /DNA_ID=CAMNT_0008520409 /DNA_START=365 /DNA_END=622 /DNA_ORIENTATION=+
MEAFSVSDWLLPQKCVEICHILDVVFAALEPHFQLVVVDHAIKNGKKLKSALGPHVRPRRHSLEYAGKVTQVVSPKELVKNRETI